MTWETDADFYNVVVYTTTYCPTCKTLKKWLHDMAYNFKEVNLDDQVNEKITDLLINEGLSILPILKYKGDYYPGFDPDRLEVVLFDC